MSAFATIGGLDVVDFRLTMPRAGVWVMEASLGDEQQPSGKVDVVVGTQQLKGVVELAATSFETTVVRVRGGGGKLATIATPKHYTNATLRRVLTDLLDQASETLSSTAASDILSRTLSHWTVLRRPIGREISSLLSPFEDVTWRTAVDGTFWLGPESWTAVEPEHDFIQDDPLSNDCTIACMGDLVLPGTTFLDKRVSAVEHSSLGGQIRSLIHFEDP